MNLYPSFFFTRFFTSLCKAKDDVDLIATCIFNSLNPIKGFIDFNYLKRRVGGRREGSGNLVSENKEIPQSGFSLLRRLIVLDYPREGEVSLSILFARKDLPTDLEIKACCLFTVIKSTTQLIIPARSITHEHDLPCVVQLHDRNLLKEA